MKAGNVEGSIKEVLILAVAAVALILLLPKIIAMVIRSSADEAGKLAGDAAAGVKDSVDNAVNAVFNPNKTDLQTINEVMDRNYDINYASLQPELKAEIQTNLGTTKAYYELHHTPMPFDVFQKEVIAQADPVIDGGCPAGYHLSTNGMGCIKDDAATTISRAEVPAGYQGTYYAGKRII